MPPKVKRSSPLTAISQAVWKQLYDAAFRVKELAPWEFMEEENLFGIQPSDTKEPAFISIMGARGEHFAVAVYPSVSGWSRFWDLQRGVNDFPRHETLLETPHLQMAFGRQEELESEEKRLIRTLGYTPKGEFDWPYFRSQRPGHAPWFIRPSEVNLLLAAMEQVLDVAPRYNEADGYAAINEPVWMRIQHGSGSDATWTDELREYPYEPLALNIQYPEIALEAVCSLPVSNIRLEVDVPILFTPIGKRHERPKFPYVLLAVDADSGFALCGDMLMMDSTVSDFWEDIPRRLLAVLNRRQLRPSQLLVKNRWMYSLLSPLCDDLDIHLELTYDLPALSEVLNFMKSGL